MNNEQIANVRCKSMLAYGGLISILRKILFRITFQV